MGFNFLPPHCEGLYVSRDLSKALQHGPVVFRVLAYAGHAHNANPMSSVCRDGSQRGRVHPYIHRRGRGGGWNRDKYDSAWIPQDQMRHGKEVREGMKLPATR